MDGHFYRAFEEKFRGPRELVKSRLKIYLPFIEPLLKFYTPASVVDIGCGRCEWLELVREHGFDSIGVDINADMLSDCQGLGLSVHLGDAIEFLRTLPDASQTVVSGFHIVEHIPFASLQDLVSESLRVLKTGGLLILETPNPENLVVGTCSFYLDPTHLRPIPPQMLKFISEFGGFKRSKILRLQEQPNLIYNNTVSIMDILNGVSPDYAVVAQKDGPQALFDPLNNVFAAEYGVTLESLANKYQQLVDSRKKEVGREMDRMLKVMLHTQALLKAAEARASGAEVRITQVEAREAEAHDQVKHALILVQQAQSSAEQAVARALQAETRATQAEVIEAEARYQVQHALTETQQAKVQAEQAKARANGLAAELVDLSAQLARTQEELHQLHQANHHHWLLANNRQEQLEEILGSTSIRLTAPLRWLGKQARFLARGALILRPKYLLQHSGRYVEGRPRLKRIALKVLQRHPELKQRLKSVVAVPVVAINQPVLDTNHRQPTRPVAEADLSHLTPRARQIFIDLKAAIAQQN